jgi:hypothetical protein
MKTLTERVSCGNGNRRGFIAFVCRSIYTVLSTSFERFGFAADEQGASPLEVDRDGQFRAFVNNRLYILILWVQRPVKRRDITKEKQHLEFFLHDMAHHFVDPYVGKDIRAAYRWIRAYVKAYPNVSKKNRTERAFEMIEKIYESLGMEYPLKKEHRPIH